MLFLLTGSAGSGKSAALAELARRREDLALLDLDDLHPPAEADASWWQQALEDHVRRAVEGQAAGKDTVLAGWILLDDVLAARSAAALGGVAACLLDCEDDVRMERVARRSASGSWRTHTPEEVEGFLEAAATLRSRSGAALRLDTTRLSVDEVVDRLDAWITSQCATRLDSTGAIGIGHLAKSADALAVGEDLRHRV